ncbi:hypothetical protein CPC08DRAFT_589069, partial [Agrocybe pediades]
LKVDLVLEKVQSDSGVDGDIYAQFTQTFDSFVVPPGQTVSSGVVPNVILVKGILESLGLLERGYLDVANAVTMRLGQGGYQ